MNNRAKILFVVSLVFLEFLFSSRIVFGVSPHLSLIALLVLVPRMSRSSVLFAAMLAGYFADTLLAAETFSYFFAFTVASLLVLMSDELLRKTISRHTALGRVVLGLVLFELTLAAVESGVLLASWIPYAAFQVVVSVIIAMFWNKLAAVLERVL